MTIHYRRVFNMNFLILRHTRKKNEKTNMFKYPMYTLKQCTYLKYQQFSPKIHL